MSLKLVLPVQSRSGSSFFVALCMKFFGGLWPQSRISGSRLDNSRDESERKLIQDYFTRNNIVDYFDRYSVKFVKLEDPMKDDYANKIYESFPNTRYAFSHRNLTDVINSHQQVRWGLKPELLIELAKKNIDFYEKINKNGGKVLGVYISNRDFNRFDAIHNYFQTNPTDETRRFFDEWMPTNTIQDQVNKGLGLEKPKWAFDIRRHQKVIQHIDNRLMNLIEETQEKYTN
ncbi:MAG: hypothetical protein JMN24_08045 [gamma proteobacterium endosymbiont of Lamellibrachia anaximandri]|nr:hypothetical protein [gamma proteobacterium endosymbiont of Lamellibrachia anaximandri]MBL3618529.1 hypothetical protein [gamma proteobacterium endosymbiont of Lamellibrachia anaximandri]